jgi:hypothetical protein
MERANESAGSHFAGEMRKDHAMAGSRKNGGATGVEKTRGKSQKNNSPKPLGNPANPAGFPLSHNLGDCA